MASTNEAIRDLELRHQVQVQRLSSGVLKRLIPLLDRADSEIVAKLLARGDVLEGSFTSVRLQRLLDAVRDINHTAHVSAGKALTAELLGIARYEAEFQQKLIGTALPISWDFVSPSVELLKAAVTARPFQGRLLKEWVSELDDAKGRRLRDSIRLGVIQGESIDQIVRRVRGTKALGYTDGVMNIGRRGAEALVRTAVAHTTTAARDELYKANADLIASEQWVSTLDTRTCPQCMALDGQKFEVGQGTLTPAHIGCRCLRIPVTKSWRELGFDIDDLPPGTRASMEGQVSATETYQTWLGRQPVEVQKDVLGPDRAALFRTGGLQLDRFVDTSGEAYTLDQLKTREIAAFEAAGLNNSIRPPRGQPQDEIARFLADDEAQTELLGRAMGDLTTHVSAVEKAIDENGWDAEVNPLLGVRHYTGSSYSGWNQRERDGKATLEDRQMTALAAKGIDQLPQVTGDIWRAPFKRLEDGDVWWGKAVVGSELDIGKQFQSFSQSQNVAQSWSSRSKLLYRITNPTRGAYIEELSQNRGEQEVLLPPGLRYKVVGKSVTGDTRIIDLEIINDA